MPVHFFTEEISFNLEKPSLYSSWVQSIIENHNAKPGDINYIFCSDDYLLKINQKHLDHDYYTDIVTFDHSENETQIDADIFISIDRVRENALTGNAEFSNELSRVMAHGLLHLLGYSDKTASEKKVMREKEEACISLQKK
ncbi:MAG: rRNA maturation RNase YbeY [Cyclobacteriaceae bacterium]